MSFVSWAKECIEMCRTHGNLNTASGAEVLLLKLAEKLDEGGIGGGGGAIRRIESNDTENMVVLRDLESGSYVLSGRFKPFAGADSVMTFSSALLVNVITRTADTQVQIFYPVNNVVQHLVISDTDYSRNDVYLNDLVYDHPEIGGQ